MAEGALGRMRPFALVIAAAVAVLACQVGESRTGDSIQVRVDVTGEQARYRNATERRLDDIDQRLADLKGRVAGSARTARDSLEKEIADIELVSRDLRARVRGAQVDTKEAWDGFTADIDRALDALSARLDRLFT
ncbi:MAG: hypothetical protein ACT4R6_02515 [Gemmatimonadaceae bacterium]